MQYQLETLEDLILENIHPKNLLITEPSKTQLEEWMSFVSNEGKRIKRELRKTANSLSQEGSRENFIQQHQKGLTRLSDTIYFYLLPVSIAEIHRVNITVSIEKLYKTTWLAIDEMLEFLKESYAKYFDLTEKITETHKLQAETELEQKMKAIKRGLIQYKLNPAFIELLCEPFESFILVSQTCNYRELEYLQVLVNSLENTLKQRIDNPEDAITEKLFYLNFNSVLFYNYCILKLKEEASKRKSVTDLVEFYSWHIKTLNQHIVKHKVIYLSHLEPIRDQLVFWIAEDLHYLNKKHQLTMALPISKEVARDKIKKVHVNLTVPDLALGARLLLDDVIINSNYSELMERIAKSFRTNRRESLSSNNTYNEGFNISVITKEKMKGLLLKLSRKVGEF